MERDSDIAHAPTDSATPATSDTATGDRNERDRKWRHALLRPAVDPEDVRAAPARALFARCRTADRLVRSASSSLSELWAYGEIASCPGGAAAMTVALRSGRDAMGPFALDSLTKSTWNLRDAGLLDAALELAADEHLPALARALALRVVLYDLRPTVAPVIAPALIGAERCAPAVVRPDSTAIVVTPIPDEMLGRARAVTSRLAGDDREPDAVRAAARCALGLSG